MARSRNIKPGVMDNEELGSLSPLHRLLFIYLWMLADREGRLEDRPVRIKAKALPYDSADVDSLLSDLSLGGFLVRYQVGDKKYIQIIKFGKHQRPHANEVASDIPPLSKVGATLATSTCHQGDKLAQPREQALRPDSLIPDSLIPDSLPPTVSDSLDIQTDQVWATYPTKRQNGVSGQIGHADQGAIAEAIVRDGFEAVISGTRNYKAATDLWPAAERQFIRSAYKFFSDGDYQNDPAIWRRPSKGGTVTPLAFVQKETPSQYQARIEADAMAAIEAERAAKATVN